MSEQELTGIVEQNQQQKCIAFFQGMSETQRRSRAPLCLKLLKHVKKNGQNVVTAEAALLATGTFSELKAVSWRVAREPDLAFALLADRRPEWIAQWADKLLNESYYWFHWGLIRRLVRANLMPKPQSPNYVLAMVSGLVGGSGRFEREVLLTDFLLADPDLLTDEVWKLFEHEGGGENSLANWDRFGRSQSWHDALLAMSSAGHLPRERLLSCSLDALERDFNQYRAKWFATFHDALAPSPQELREKAARYLRLVGASATSIASWAIEIVGRLAKEGAYDPPTLIAGLQPAFSSRQKGFAKRALELLDEIAQSSPDAARGVVQAAATALGHETSDVQKAALDLIDKHAAAVDAELAATLASYTPSVAASLRTRLSRWAGGGKERFSPDKQPGQKQPAQAKKPDTVDLSRLSQQQRELYGIEALLANIEAGRAEIPAATFDGTEIPRLKSLQRLTPIADLDELIDVCAAVVEDETRVDDAERALDGLSRLCDRKPDDFDRRVGPLAKRTTQRLKKDAIPFLGMGPGGDLCGVIYAWTTGQAIEWKKHPERKGLLKSTIAGEEQTWFPENLRKGLGVLSRRSIALAKRVAAGQSAALLSAPTHAGGWIEPRALVDRVNGWSGDDPDLTDVCLAMLRFAPDGRQEALASLQESTTVWGRAIRYSLGAPRVTLGENAALWITAARARSPWTDDERIEKAFPDRGPDAGRASAFAVSFKKESYWEKLTIRTNPPTPKPAESNCATVILHTQRGVGRGLEWELGGPAGRTAGAVRWTATIWPQARESLFAAALEAIARNIDWSDAAWQNKSLLEPLLDSGTPLREMGLMLLAVALAAKEPGEYGLATDIAIRAIEDGRLGSDNLGQVLAQLLLTGLIKPGRWQKTLADVARVSPVHALVVQQALQRAFRGQPDKLPRDFVKLLELLLELSVELDQHIGDVECRVCLQQVASGKAGKTAKALLALPAANFSLSSRHVLVQAIEQRAAALG